MTDLRPRTDGLPAADRPSSPAPARRRRRAPDWLVPTGLVVMSLVPLLGGAVRLSELAGGAEVTAANARFVASPVPIVVHVLAATLFCVVGAFQFHRGLRRRRIAWHRRAGRVLAVAGVLAAGSGVWMALTYPPAPGDGVLLAGIRVVFGTAMLVAIVLAIRAVLARDLARHRAWMIRGYAIGQGAGTQVLVFIPVVVAVGEVTGTARALLMAFAWVLNLAVAEWAVRRG